MIIKIITIIAVILIAFFLFIKIFVDDDIDPA